jgi:hypothetical protein
MTYTVYAITEKAIRTAYANENKHLHAYAVKGTLKDVKAFITANGLNVSKVYNGIGKIVKI